MFEQQWSSIVLTHFITGMQTILSMHLISLRAYHIWLLTKRDKNKLFDY